MKRFSGKCLNCGKPIPQKEQRRGLCNRCYLAEYHGQELGLCCEVCGFGDRRMLVRRKIDGEYHTLCGNCATLWGRRKMSVEDLRAELFPDDDRRSGDRRKASVRRTYNQRDGIDPRFWDRASPERRDMDRRGQSTSV